MWQRLRDWLASYSITAKSVAVGWAGLSVLYVENQAFHDFVFKLFSRFPHFMQEFVVGFAVPIALMIGKWRKAKEATS